MAGGYDFQRVNLQSTRRSGTASQWPSSSLERLNDQTTPCCNRSIVEERASALWTSENQVALHWNLPTFEVLGEISMASLIYFRHLHIQACPCLACMYRVVATPILDQQLQSSTSRHAGCPFDGRYDCGLLVARAQTYSNVCRCSIRGLLLSQDLVGVDRIYAIDVLVKMWCSY